jgi:uncharacterized protein (TIGR00251 family)
MHQCELAVRLQPRASADEIVGERDGVLLARVRAPPVEGRANDALCRLIAKRLRIAAGRVEVIRGARGRDKLVRVNGLSAEQVRHGLGIGAGS